MEIARLTFNPFQENTYILYDETGECVIIDPGCYEQWEKDELREFISKNNLRPVRLLNTHCHIDHVLGNHFAASTWGLLPEIHPLELTLLEATVAYGPGYGLYIEPSPAPKTVLEDGMKITFGNTTLQLLHTPGHSPGSICFHHQESGRLIGGDVLFLQSIGRTDLPGGDMKTLLDSIANILFKLDDETIVYPGHGPETKTGFEKTHNPFLN